MTVVESRQVNFSVANSSFMHFGRNRRRGNTRDMVVKIVEVAAEADLLPLLCTCTFFVAEFR
eukprot:scaffold860_cov141-Skeletonema_menzelii.AAC.3